MRVSILSYKMPELYGTKYGCFAKLPRHPPEEGRRYFATTYYDSFSKRFDQMKFKPKSNRMFALENKFSGTESKFEPVERIKITTKLISEKFNEKSDPKYNTEIQRTWINYRDPGIRAVTDLHFDNTKTIPLPKVDNDLSLPMFNDKEYDRVRAKSVYGCPKKFSDVTKSTFQITNLRKY